MSFWCQCFDQKTNKNIVRNSALKVSIASLGPPLGFLGLLVDLLINDMTYKCPKAAQKSFEEAPRKLQKIQGRNPYNIFVAILVETMIPKRHFDIN